MKVNFGKAKVVVSGSITKDGLIKRKLTHFGSAVSSYKRLILFCVCSVVSGSMVVVCWSENGDCKVYKKSCLQEM